MSLSIISSKAGSSFDFIPFPKDKQITDVETMHQLLALLHSVYRHMINAIEDFYLGRYELFDAQVSENLCQIRAFECQILARTCDGGLYCPVPKSLIGHALNKFPLIETFFNQDLRHLLETPLTVYEFLDQHHVLLAMPQKTIWLTQCYLLSHCKMLGKHNIPSSIIYPILTKDTGISSKTFLKRFVHQCQRNISAISCERIFDIAKSQGSNNMQHLKALYQKDEIGRHVLPAFEVTRILLDEIFLKKQPFVMVVHRTSHLEKDTLCFGIHIDQLDQYDHATIVFEARADYGDMPLDSRDEYIKRAFSMGVKKIILWNMAQHPQYAGSKLSLLKANPYPDAHEHIAELQMFLQYRQYAKILGCSRDNPRFLLITHIHCEPFASVAQHYKIKQEAHYLAAS
jgi:hypothetical protein